MTLLKRSAKSLANSVLSGGIELGEIPQQRRQAVVIHIKTIKEATVEASEVTMENKKGEIMEALDALGVGYSPSMTKAELLELL